MRSNFSFFILFLLTAHLSFAQSSDLPRVTSWNPKICTFNDGSYVLELIGKISETNYQRRLISYSASGEIQAQKDLSTEDHWGFSADPINVSKDGTLRSVVDRTDKISYTLHISKSGAKVTITDADFGHQEVDLGAKEFGKQFYGANYGTNSSLGKLFLSYIGQDGNPAWIMRSGMKEYLFVHYDRDSKKGLVRELTFVKEDLELIGREDGKSWLAQFEDFGAKKSTYALKIFSVDEKGNLKEERTVTLQKPTEIMVSKLVRIRDVEQENAMLFGVAHFDGKVFDGESDFVKHIDFISATGGEYKQSLWDVGTQMQYNGIPYFVHHYLPSGDHRFLITAGQSALSLDASFEDPKVGKMDGAELQRVGWADLETWNFLLYRDELSEQHLETIGSLVKEEKNVQFVFKIKDKTFIIVHGTHFYAEKQEAESSRFRILQ